MPLNEITKLPQKYLTVSKQMINIINITQYDVI